MNYLPTLKANVSFDGKELCYLLISSHKKAILETLKLLSSDKSSILKKWII
jgi:hypothetical protein